MGDGIGPGLLPMSVCFDFRRSANVATLVYLGLSVLGTLHSTGFDVYHPLIIQLNPKVRLICVGFFMGIQDRCNSCSLDQ